jgi:hypothetical protein
MLKQEIRHIIYILIAVGFIGCNIEEVNQEFDNYFIFEDYKLSNYNNYKELSQLLTDSLNSWKNDSLLISKPIFFNAGWQIDSVIIFNKDSSRLYTTRNSRVLNFKDSKMDYIKEFLGAKIGNQWYFYPGASYVVPRQNYQDSMYAPLTFEELSYVAHKRPMAGMLLRDKDGKVVVNHERMNDRFFGGFPTYTREQIDSTILSRVRKMHTKKLDPDEVEDIKSRMASSVRPEEPFLPSRAKKEKSWWVILTKNDPGVKIFESEEWKNRHAN